MPVSTSFKQIRPKWNWTLDREKSSPPTIIVPAQAVGNSTFEPVPPAWNWTPACEEGPTAAGNLFAAPPTARRVPPKWNWTPDRGEGTAPSLDSPEAAARRVPPKWNWTPDRDEGTAPSLDSPEAAARRVPPKWNWVAEEGDGGTRRVDSFSVDPSGQDPVVCGPGSDTVVINPLPASGQAISVAGFGVADDTFQLVRTGVFTALDLGPLDSAAFWSGSAAHDADDRIIYNPATGALLYDADGNGAGAAIQIATLTGVAGTLTAADFVVVA